MAMRARVGRHRQEGGRQCQNSANDQLEVIALLNVMPVALGGAGHGLGHGVAAGICSDELYRVIVAFEDRYFPGQRSGYVDPGGRMHNRMVDLARGQLAAAPPPPAPAPPPETPLDLLRRNLLDPAQSKWIPYPTRAAFVEPLIKLAVATVDMLKKDGLVQLPFPALFGRAHVIDPSIGAIYYPDEEGLQFFYSGVVLPSRYNWKAPALPLMQYGLQVDAQRKLVTEEEAALVLFPEGTWLGVPPYHQTYQSLEKENWYLKRGLPVQDFKLTEIVGHP